MEKTVVDISQRVLNVRMDLTSKLLFIFPSDMKKLQRVTGPQQYGAAVMKT